MSTLVVEKRQSIGLGRPSNFRDIPRIREKIVGNGDPLLRFDIKKGWYRDIDSISRLIVRDLANFGLQLIVGRGIDQLNLAPIPFLLLHDDQLLRIN